MNAEELAAIRERDAENEPELPPQEDRRALLAHIDALTAKVEGLPVGGGHENKLISRAAVLAILRGEA